MVYIIGRSELKLLDICSSTELVFRCSEYEEFGSVQNRWFEALTRKNLGAYRIGRSELILGRICRHTNRSFGALPSKNMEVHKIGCSELLLEEIYRSAE
jgi:hypothetical protein